MTTQQDYQNFLATITDAELRSNADCSATANANDTGIEEGFELFSDQWWDIALRTAKMCADSGV